MAEEVEQIEAKLCRYIDGLLDEQQRAQLEEHLASHPDHRLLINEMIGHKCLLADLPHEAAPTDLMEELQGQLERESLLGGEQQHHTQTALRINRWPQILSTAAILVLSTGLGLVVYSLLPSRQPTVASSTLKRDEATDRAGGGREATVLLPLSPSTPKEMAEKLLAESPAPTGRIEGAAVATTSSAKATGSVAGGLMVDGLASETRNRGMIARKGTVDQLDKSIDVANITPRSALPVEEMALVNAHTALTDPQPSQTLVITITADNLDQANDQVLRYLSANNIAWSNQSQENLAAPMRRLLQTNNAVSNDAMNVNAAQASAAPAAAPVVAPLPEAGFGGKTEAEREPLNLEKAKAVQVPAMAKSSLADGETVARRVQASLADATPKSVARLDADRKAAAADSPVQQRPQGPLPRLILARNMNQAQVTELTNSLTPLRLQAAGSGNNIGNQMVRQDRVAQLDSIRAEQTPVYPAQAQQMVLSGQNLPYNCLIVLRNNVVVAAANAITPTTEPTSRPAIEK